MSPVGLRPEKSCTGDVQQGKTKNKNYRPDFSSERVPHITKSVTVQKYLKKEGKKIGCGSEMGA
jgi:hypothetical protein